MHRRVLQAGAGAPGIRDLGALYSDVPQPKATSGDVDLYPTVVENAMETFLILNGTEIDATVEDQERLMLDLAAGRWLRHHLRPLA